MIDLKVAKKNMREIAFWCVSLTAVIVFGGLVTKKLVADPLAANSQRLMQAVSEEREARQAGDALIIERLQGSEADSLMISRLRRIGHQAAMLELRLIDVQNQLDIIQNQTRKRGGGR